MKEDRNSATNPLTTQEVMLSSVEADIKGASSRTKAHRVRSHSAATDSALVGVVMGWLGLLALRLNVLWFESFLDASVKFRVVSIERNEA